MPDLAELPLAILALNAAGRVTQAHGSLAAWLAGGDTSRLLGLEASQLFERGGSVLVNAQPADDLPEHWRRAPAETVKNTSDQTRTLDALIGPDRNDEDGADGQVLVLFDVAHHTQSDRATREELDRLREQLAESEAERDKLGNIRRELHQSAAEAPRIIGSSAKVLAMQDQARRVAPTTATVLIHGESGSGKELVARTVHALSPRNTQPLIAVNCAALPETLLESELFGHEQGAFTGADRQRLGKFELADGGSLFLDEIAELSLQAQAKLLRVLQEGTLERVGGTETIHVDVRLVAATHRDLAVQVQRGRFREDLFYRLNVFRIDVPPLRERKEDLRELIEFFHGLHARRLDRDVLTISERSVRALLSYRWPGNVRELENTVERATLLSSGPELEIPVPQSPAPTFNAGDVGGAASPSDTSAIPRDVLLDLTIDQLQRLQIVHALEACEYKVFGEDGAAQKLAIKPQTLLSRMDKLGVPRPRAMRAAVRAMRRGSA